MKKMWMAAGVVFCLVSGAFAIDRDARMIDTLTVEGGNYKDLSYAGLSLQVENLLAAPSEKWAVLAGVTGGQFNPDTGPRVNSWSLAMGIRYYLMPVTAISLFGSYRNDDASAFKVAAGTASIRQRLIPASRYVSPWIEGRFSVQDADLAGGFLSQRDRSFTALVTTLEAGCDFMMSRQFAFVFNAGVSDTSTVQSGPQYADGFFAGVGMRYYWP